MKKETISELTKKQLSSSLLKAMKDKPIDKISIREIVDGCGFPRSTFYYHFDDIYDLAAWSLADRAVELMRTDGEPAVLWDESLVRLFEGVRENIDVCRNALGSSNFLRIADSFCDRAVDKMLPDIIVIDGDRNTDPEFLRFLTMFYGHSMIDVCSKWFRGSMEATPEEMAELLNLVIKENFLSTLDRVQRTKNMYNKMAFV